MWIDYLYSDLKSNLYFSKVDFFISLSQHRSVFRNDLKIANAIKNKKTHLSQISSEDLWVMLQPYWSEGAGKVVYGFIPHKFVVWLLASLSLSLASLLGNNPFVNTPDCLWCEASCQAATEYSMKCPSIRRSVKLIHLVTVTEWIRFVTCRMVRGSVSHSTACVSNPLFKLICHLKWIESNFHELVSQTKASQYMNCMWIEISKETC